MISWDGLCRWYREHRFGEQLDLYLPFDETEISRWSSFIERRCVEPILRSPHLTRSLLFAGKMIAASPQKSAAGLASVTSLWSEITA